jgi:hypothetical protein
MDENACRVRPCKRAKNRKGVKMGNKMFERYLKMSAELEKKIQESLVEGKLPCPTAFKIAKEMNVTVKEIGETCNKLRIKVRSCQLGCFP